MKSINENPDWPYISPELKDELLRRKVTLTPAVRLWSSATEAVFIVAGKQDRKAVENVAAETKTVLKTLSAVAIAEIATALNGGPGVKGFRDQLGDFASEAEMIRNEVREHRLTFESGVQELPRIVRNAKVLFYSLLFLVAVDAAVTTAKFVSLRPKASPEITNPIIEELRRDRYPNGK